MIVRIFFSAKSYHYADKNQRGIASAQFYKIEGGRRPLPPPIIFEWQNLPQQIIYRRKENLTENIIHFKYRKIF